MVDMRPKPLRFLISAGPCHEPLDRVRFLGNRSSGRLGIAVADTACRMGGDVTLLLGPTCLVPRVRAVDLKRFETTADLENLLFATFDMCDVLVMAAAVADFRPTTSIDTLTKIERSSSRITIDLEPTPDLVAGCARRKRPDQTIVAFALEPADRLRERAVRKLERKQVDLIVANPLETMDSDTVSATLFGRAGSLHEQGTVAPADMPKSAFASWLIEHVIQFHTATRQTPSSSAIETQ